MVTVKFAGRFANCVFQYWAAAAFARKNDLDLATPWPLHRWVRFIHEDYETERQSIGHVYSQNIEINDDNFEDYYTRHISAVPRANYTFSGYFQRVDLLDQAFVQTFFDWKKVDAIGDDDICMHVRLCDHGAGRLYLDPQWYAEILEKQKFKRLTICTDDPFAHGFFDLYKKWNPVIRFSPNAMDDFDTLRAHRTIIIGPSSFAVLAALTGHATCVFQWKRDQELPHIKYQIPSTPERLVFPVDGKYWRETR